jgi:(aminoalkyl)phosphonate N-acetyltransferase
MKIRRAELNDSEKIFEFICELENVHFDYEVFLPLYKSNIANTENIYLLAVDESNKILGYISSHGQFLLHHNSKVYEIQELFVDSEYRNQKIGENLVNEVEKIITARGSYFLEVTTNHDRIDTHRFYKKCGFEQTHVKFTKNLEVPDKD